MVVDTHQGLKTSHRGLERVIQGCKCRYLSDLREILPHREAIATIRYFSGVRLVPPPPRYKKISLIKYITYIIYMHS
jgi:hypothetical protein